MEAQSAAAILKAIEESTEGDPALLALERELLDLAVRYARIRTDWRLAGAAQRAALDGPRRIAHDALIDQCNIVSRAVGKAGRANEWRRALGDDRKEIGDFACHVHAILGVQAR